MRSTPSDGDVHVEQLRGVARNATALLLAYVFPRVFTFGSVVFAARALGTEDFGAYGTAAAFAVVLSILSSLGMLPLLVRDIARDPGSAPRLVRAAHIVKTLAGALTLLTLLALARLLGYSPEVTAAALLLGVGYWMASYADNLSAYYQGVERMRVCTEASAAFGLISGALGVLLVTTTHSIVWFSAAFAIGQGAALGWLLVRAPSAVRWGAAGSRADVTRLVRTVLPFTVAFIALTLFYKVDVLVLERFRTSTEVGLYSAAYKFVDVFHALVLVGVAAVFPRLSRAAVRAEAGGRGRWAATRAAELVVLVTVPAAGTLWLMRVPAVGIFGDAYAGSVTLLSLLAPALPALALNLYGGYVLGAAKRMGWMAALYAVALAAKVGIQIVAVPRVGALGTAGAVLVSEVLLATSMVLVLGRVAGAAPGRQALLLAFGAAALAWGVGLTLAPAGAFVAGAVYPLTVALLYAAGGAVSVGERQAIRGALFLRGPAQLPAEGVS